MTGKEFEDAVARWARSLGGDGSIGRYGVQSVRTGGPLGAIQIKSLPDFEGIMGWGDWQYIWDCKACSQASFNLAAYRDRKKRQLTHMIERSRFGAICGFLIHWNERKLKTKTEKEETWWFPVHHLHPFWESFFAAEVKRITRIDCMEHGKEVAWHKNKPMLTETLKLL